MNKNHPGFFEKDPFRCAFYCPLALHKAEKEVCGISEIKALQGNLNQSCHPYLVHIHMIYTIHIYSRSRHVI